jgi:two-component system, OmpR family, alkaline phosphatase synthesis response regulator PhoP
MAKILVVDDEKDVIELLKFLLEKDGFEVITSFNGKDALEKIGVLPSDAPPVRPDLLILDVMMPQMDGYTVQTKLMENDETKNIPIVILTAKGQMKDLFGMASNVVAYIEKPFDPKTLREKIKELVNNIK